MPAYKRKIATNCPLNGLNRSDETDNIGNLDNYSRKYDRGPVKGRITSY